MMNDSQLTLKHKKIIALFKRCSKLSGVFIKSHCITQSEAELSHLMRELVTSEYLVKYQADDGYYYKLGKAAIAFKKDNENPKLQLKQESKTMKTREKAKITQSTESKENLKQDTACKSKPYKLKPVKTRMGIFSDGVIVISQSNGDSGLSHINNTVTLTPKQAKQLIKLINALHVAQKVQS
ncbi:hypothetical protein [Kingella negevensis]|uniref:hypothetical protein n=1 Tax=Kingella negevensis TaxID=1522312 RepID=UPI00050A0345|nr:hypothetical protein [Kingella negevensis]MDK4688538.1 hypothetical protein [Kingella negevensis]MDK4689753.1 hypothetical protein [Kingella negevensis]WII91720.1 hypothetical protein QEO93_03825 [Kingella negevensis]